MTVTLYRSNPKLAVASASRPIRADQASLSGSDIQTWSGADILQVCRSPILRNRYEFWQKLARKDRAPLLKDLYGSEEEARLEESMLLLQQGSDFIYVHQGAQSVEKYGKIFRGLMLSTIEGGMTASFLNLYNGALRDMQPRYVQFKTEFSARHVRWERVALPLVSDDRQQAKFIMTYSEPLDDKLDILTATFDRSPIGMIAAARPIGPDRTLDEAEILLVNTRARTLLRLPSAGLMLPTIADLRKWIREVAGWSQIGDPGANPTSGRSTLAFRDGSDGRRITVVVEPIDHFVIYHFIDGGTGG